AVASDAQTIARQGELAGLRLHVSLRDDSFVYVKRALAEGFAVPAGLVANELHAERVLARLELIGDKLLLRLDAQEVVAVMQLPVLDVQSMAAEARAVRKDHTGTIRVGDLDVGQDLVGATTRIDGHTFRHWRGSRVVYVTLSGLLLARALHAQQL